jgi:hypothetical protein
LLVTLQVVELQPAHSLIQEPLAGFPEVDEQAANRVTADSRDSLCRADRRTFGQKPQDELGLVGW